MSSNRHHRRPRSQGGGGGKNVVRVNSRRHYFWHCMFSNMSAEEIMHEINNSWLDERFKITVQPRDRR